MLTNTLTNPSRDVPIVDTCPSRYASQAYAGSCLLEILNHRICKV